MGLSTASGSPQLPDRRVQPVHRTGRRDRMRGNGLKLPQGRFRLDIGVHLSMESHKALAQLPRTVVQSPSWEGLKSHVDVALGAWVSVGLGSGGGIVGFGGLRGLFQPKLFCDSTGGIAVWIGV